MRRFVIILFIPIIFESFSLAGLNERHRWWDIREKALAKQIEEISARTDIDESVKGLLLREKERAHSMLELYREHDSGSGSLQYEQKTYTAEDIQRAIVRIAEPVFNLRYFEYMAKMAGSYENLEPTRKAILSDLEGLHKDILKQNDSSVSSCLFSKYINPLKQKTIAFEFFMGGLMLSRGKIFKKIERMVHEEVGLSLGKGKCVSNRHEIEKVINKAVLEIIDSIDFNKEISHDQISLNRSWSWMEIREKVRSELKSLGLLRDLTCDVLDVKYQSLEDSSIHPEVLESVIFRGNKDISWKFRNISKNRDRNSSQVLVIPQSPDWERAIGDIDDFRKKIVKSTASGPISEGRIKDLQARFSCIVKKHTALCEGIFLEQEKRIKDRKIELLEQTSGKSLFQNDEEFYKARDNFNSDCLIVKDYAERSALFSTAIAQLRKGRDVRGLYAKRVKRINEYCEFIKDMVFIASQYSCAEGDFLRRFRHSVYLNNRILNLLTNSLGLNRCSHSTLSGKDYKKIISMRKNASVNIKRIRKEISDSYKDYQVRFSKKYDYKKNAQQSLRYSLAQHEVLLLLESLKDHADLFKSRDYTGRMIDEYTKTYMRIAEKIKGDDSRTVINQIKNAGSIFRLLPDFSKEKFVREKSTRKYLAVEGMRSLARLVSLTDEYRRSGFSIKGIPPRGDLLAYRTIFSEKPQKKIADWTMNEDNIEKIDGKLMAYLARSHHYALISRGEDPGEARHRSEVIKYAGNRVIFKLSKNLISRSPSELDRMQGVIGWYINPDGRSEVRIIARSADKISLSDVTYKWIKTTGAMPVKKEWFGKNKEYFKVISRAKMGQILETYAFSDGSHCYIISGLCDRSVYNSFVKGLCLILNSMENVPDSVAGITGP